MPIAVSLSPANMPAPGWLRSRLAFRRGLDFRQSGIFGRTRASNCRKPRRISTPSTFSRDANFSWKAACSKWPKPWPRSRWRFTRQRTLRLVRRGRALLFERVGQNLVDVLDWDELDLLLRLLRDIDQVLFV